MPDGMDELRTYSARWGANADYVQGAGGNTSFKRADRLTVKASGFRMADALNKDIFVELDLAAARAMADGAPAPAVEGPRPSIETSLHGLMPHPVVAHLHMVAAIAYGVRADAESALAAPLAGLAWTFVPYLKPGAPVAQAVRATLARTPADIIVLGNHGVVLGGDSFAAVDALAGEVARRLETSPIAPPARAEELAAVGRRHNLEPARLETAHWAATDPDNLAFATAGSLYPDHLVFLGRGAARLGDAEPGSKLFLAPGVGALLEPGLAQEAHEMAACLGAVVARIPRGADLSTLTRQDEDALLDWDAERYRREMKHS